MANNKQLSIALVKLLRHNPRGISLTEEGYANVEDILKLSSFKKYEEDDIWSLVDDDEKTRFAIRTYQGKLQVKATQGHSIGLSNPELEMITHHTQARVVLHGTRKSSMDGIRLRGLSRMRRDHIHFAPGESNVQSGFPPGCDMVIEIDLKSALEDGIKFYKSENGVILSKGDSNGCIPSKHFKRAYDRRTNSAIDFR